MSDVHALVRAAFAGAASPSPSPGPAPNPADVTPGVVGFVVTFLVGIATLLLIFDMVRRIRRTRYRAEIVERLDAEEAGEGEPAPEGHAPGQDAPEGRDGGAVESERGDSR